MIGFICGFIGAGGGMMMLLILTSVLGYIFCVLSTLIFARVAAKYANKAEPIVLNRITGVVLALIGSIILLVNLI